MTTKITVSLPDEQVAALRDAVSRGEARSVSAMVGRAVAAHTERESLAQLLAHLDAVHGPVPDEDDDWARTVLGRA